MIAAAVLSLAAQAPERGIDVSRQEAERITAAFAQCEVKSQDGRAAALAFTREVAGTPSTYPKRLIRSGCAPRGTTMRFSPSLFRIALFPALYARDHAADTAVPAMTPADYAGEYDGTPDEPTLALRRFGDCVVGKDGATSRRVVLSKLYSAEEAAAVAQLRPALGGCVTQGQDARFSRTVLRGAIAEALYKASARARGKVN